MRALLIAFVLGCGDNTEIPVFLDASCVVDADPRCCALLPDLVAVRACAEVPFNACAVLACPDGDCGFRRIEICNRVPYCVDLNCVSLACDFTAQCTCELPSGQYESCDGNNPP